MAFAFKTKKVATAKLHEQGKTTFISTPGVTSEENSPAVYATQINKVLDVGGKTVVADAKMTVTQVREVVESV
ncbi:MAG: hypothetical protein IKN16_09995 [Selenomonadaceae bacterium]|nr:hypothetical protein [Selenomonadaceae bacterium]